MGRLIAALFFFLVFCGAARAQENLYGATGTGGAHGELYILDPASGAVLSDIGSLNDAAGNNYSLTGLRYDASLGTLFGITTGQQATDPNWLVQVDPRTAQVTPVGALGTRLTDLAYSGGAMYGVSGSTQFFYAIDPLSGAATRLGNTGVYTQEGGGFTANAAGQMFGVTIDNFYSVDPATGVATITGNTGLSIYVNALAFTDSGILLGSAGGSFRVGGMGNGEATRELVAIDLATGLATELGATVKNLDAIAFAPANVPEPSALAYSLGGFALLLAWLRWRR